jgi:hypothetical protein
MDRLGMLPYSEDLIQEIQSKKDKLIRKLFLSIALDCLNNTKPINYNPDTYFNDAGTTWDVIGGVYLRYAKPANLEISKCSSHFYEWKNEVFSYFSNEELETMFVNKLSLDDAKLTIQNKLNNE